MNLHGKHRRPPDPVEPERTALILIDVINDMDSPDLSRGFLDAAGIAARQIRELKRRAKAAGIPTIYANDNYQNFVSYNRVPAPGAVALLAIAGIAGMSRRRRS